MAALAAVAAEARPVPVAEAATLAAAAAVTLAAVGVAHHMWPRQYHLSP